MFEVSYVIYLVKYRKLRATENFFESFGTDIRNAWQSHANHWIFWGSFFGHLAAYETQAT